MNVQNLKMNKSFFQYLKCFICDNKGSIIIEFFFSIVLLMLLLFFMVDLAIMRGNLAKLDNISYSMVTLLRERTQLYRQCIPTAKNCTSPEKTPVETEKRENLKEEDVEPLVNLARQAYYGKNSKKPLYMIIKSLRFKDANPNNGKIDEKTGGDSDLSICSPTAKLDDFKQVAPHSELDFTRIIPLYQVTICVPAEISFFKSFIGETQFKDGLLRSSSIAVGR